jgi:hypothetical protein
MSLQPEENRSMFPALLSSTTILCAILLPIACRAAPLDQLKSLNLNVPSSDMLLPGPGADAINNNCLVCHSADHILNQPSLSKKAWGEVVQKMITAYKAPTSSQDATAIIDYLVRTEGTK